MLRKIIHFTVPAAPTRLQLGCIARARELHPDWEIKVWTDPVDPSSFRLAHYWNRVNSGAQLADLIRLEVVHRFGGFYVDSDVFLHQPLDPLLQLDGFIVSTEDGSLLTNAIFGAPANSPVLENLIEQLLRAEPDWRVPPNVTTGPVFFSRSLRWRKDVIVLARETFYPYNWHEAPRPPGPLTYGTHLWANSWASSGRGFWLHQKHKIAAKARSWVRRLACAAMANGLYARTRPKILGYSKDAEVVRSTIHGHMIVMAGADVSITPHLMKHGYYEVNDELFVKKTLKGGDHFVDVGANVGVYSLLAAARVGPFGRVYSFEPNPQVASMLERSSILNWCHDRVKVLRIGVGDSSGSKKLSFSPNNLGGASFVDSSDDSGFQATTGVLAGSEQSITVPIVRLDDFFNPRMPIKILKIDAEGFECAILRGAELLIRNRSFEYLIVEILPEIYGAQWVLMRAQLKSLLDSGYLPRVAGRNGNLRPVDPSRLLSGDSVPTRNIIFQRQSSGTPAA